MFAWFLCPASQVLEIELQTELAAWRRVQAEAQQLDALATECQRVIDAAQPEKSTGALKALQEKSGVCRRAANARRRDQESATDELAAAEEDARKALAPAEEHALDWLKAKAGFPATIDADTNESWLWHGTSATIDITNPDGTQQRVDTWEVLAKHGFDERVASDSGLYGAGSYFADASSKANQYATAQRARQPLNADGHHCMLSCRVPGVM